MSQTIETLLADLCAKHDLTSISLGFHTRISEGRQFNAYTHWAHSTGLCGSGDGGSASEAIANAIKDAAAIRNRHIDVPAEIVLGEAA